MIGLDRFTRDFQHLTKTPIAILSNHATLSATGYPAAYELLRQGFSVRKIYSPEHGITSQGEDGKVQPSGHDELTRLQVVSLYGKDVSPMKEDLDDVEIVVADLPNIGCRFYTYWWTITQMMEACAAFNKKLFILDRPNLSGRSNALSEGPMLDEANCSSFIGRWRMPVTNGNSYGELGRWFAKEKNLDVAMTIVPFDHEPVADEPFIPTSPSIPGKQAVLIYPCTGLFEGLNVNTGRGTSFPFRVIGAPWINSIKLYEDFNKQRFPGVTVTPYSYRPEWSRYYGSLCYGIYFFVSNRETFKPVRTGLWLMNYLSIHYPEHLTQGLYPTMTNPSGENHLDLLLGIKNAYKTFCSGRQSVNLQLDQMLDVSGWTSQVDSFLSEDH